MPVSATASESVTTGAGVRSDAYALVGNTPLVQLGRSGDGLVYVKHEGLQAGGSYFDRVAAAQLERMGRVPEGVLVEGTTSWVVSVLTLCNRLGVPVVVVAHGDAPARLVGLIRKLGGRLIRWSDPDDRSAHLGDWEAQGYVYLDRNDPVSHRAALTAVARECAQSLEHPLSTWVIVDYGLDAVEASNALGAALGYAVEVELVPDDHEVERTLEGSAACRRTQVGHREGMLISPIGAEVIDRAVGTALAAGTPVCAVLPDGGHRYLGWW